MLGDEPTRAGRRPRHRERPRDGSRELSAKHGLPVDPDAKVEDLPVGAAAARRDPQGAVPRGRHPHPRRAHRRAHAAGDRRAASASCASSRHRARRSSSSRTSCARCSRSPTGSRCCGSGAVVGDGRHAETDAAPAGHDDGRPRGRARRSTRPTRHPAESVLVDRPTCTVEDDRGLAAVNGVRPRGARRRDRRRRRRRGQRPARAGRGAGRACAKVVPATMTLDGLDITKANPRQIHRRGRRPHPRGP